MPHRQRRSAAGVVLAGALAFGPAAIAEGEARLSLDVREANVADLVRLLAEVGRFQVVMDPGVSCALTLKLHEVRWTTALDAVLRPCGLGREQQGGVMRVAPLARLAEEAAAQRRLAEERRASAPRRLTLYRLSYARAQQIAPHLKRFLSPRGEVSYDDRTNTLLILDASE
jgi:type IV pilus assembly protein PilQ